MKKLITSLVFIIFLSSTTFAEDHAKVKSRPLPEEIEKQITENLKKEETQESKHSCGKEIQSGAFFSSLFSSLFYSYGTHFLSAVSALGDAIVLEDGSTWAINCYDGNEILKWTDSDSLLIYPNTSWFSRHNYKIYNKALKTSIEVTMIKGPYLDSPHSRQIVAIDKIKNELYLSDNSRWTICNSDKYILDKWLEGDYIVIGSYSSWFCFSKNILINSNMYNHVRAQPF